MLIYYSIHNLDCHRIHLVSNTGYEICTLLISIVKDADITFLISMIT